MCKLHPFPVDFLAKYLVSQHGTASCGLLLLERFLITTYGHMDTQSYLWYSYKPKIYPGRAIAQTTVLSFKLVLNYLVKYYSLQNS